MLKHLKLDLSPFKKYPNYRFLYTGQFVSVFGTMITAVAIPYQMYAITKSTFHVGLLGIVQLVPLVISGFWGGALADSFDRRRLVINAELGMCAGNLALILFTLQESNNYYILYALAGLMAILKGLASPAIEALTQQLIDHKDIPKVSTLQSIKNTIGHIGGPALGGVLIASFGMAATYIVDLITFLFSILMVMKIKDVPLIKERTKASVSSIKEGFTYAITRPHLLGTYVVDMMAMTLAYPHPLFPAFSEIMGGPEKLGWFYSAPAIGAFLASITSSWTHKTKRHGLGITLASVGWCLGIAGFGYSSNFYLGIFCLMFAGFVDMLSGIFRSMMWNETIPKEFRGRLASVEMISYSSGPLLGNTFMGTLATGIGPARALFYGGMLGAAGSLFLGRGIKKFWDYQAAREDSHA